jgi:protein OS-9
MATSDTILFVKETKTCSYVLVINTPRLCGEPGFKTRHDAGEQGEIRCREIVDSLPEERVLVPESDYPRKMPRQIPTLPSPKEGVPKEATLPSKGKGSHADAIRKAVQALLGKNYKDINVDDGQQMVVQGVTDNGELVIEFLDDIVVGGNEADNAAAIGAERLARLLQDVVNPGKANERIQTEKGSPEQAPDSTKEDPPTDKKKPYHQPGEEVHHDEL